MDLEGYHHQLRNVNQMLRACPGESEKEELLSLKDNLEELISLANEEQNQETFSSGYEENEQKYNSNLDDEYALFMAEIAEEGALDDKPGPSSYTSPKHNKERYVESMKSSGKCKELESKQMKNSGRYKELEGKKFRAPHRHSWGQVVYHNAMVCSVPNKIPVNDDFEVRVLFLNPTHEEMQPCPYYFNSEKSCNYDEDQCRYSHGEFVPYLSLLEYIEPHFECLTIGSAVLAKRSDDLWYRAKIANISDGNYTVKFEIKKGKNDIYEDIDFEHILPLEKANHDSDDASEHSDVAEAINDFEAQIENDLLEAKRRNEELINTSLMKVPDNQPLGDWEKYTKGIGSKLMQKMGYIIGTGLGKRGAGITKPVTALVLPKGKSLDYCMNLKEKKNKPDLFHADRKVNMSRIKNKLKKKLTKIEARMERMENMDLTKFLKYRFSFSTRPITEVEEYRVLNEKLKGGKDKDLYKGSFMVDERIKSFNDVITKLKIDIKRLEDIQSETNLVKLENRLRSREADLKYLNTYKLMIKNEIDRRKNNKSMAVF